MELSYQIPRAALLWVLAAVLLVILPQSLRMPVWITLIALLCIGWRLLIHFGKLGYPDRWTRVTVVVLTLAVSLTQLRNFGMGLDSAAALLTLGFVFKLTEMRHKRDIYIVLSLCFIMAMVAFLYSQSALVTLYMALTFLVIITAMIKLNRTSSEQRDFATPGLALKMGLQALPLAIVLFVLFPRIAPLWAVPYQDSGGTTGVTDEMSPGDLAQLGRSSELAFRVQFEGSLPPLHENLYWRGLVLEYFDGTTWSRTRPGSSYSEAASINNFQWNWENRVRINDEESLRYNVIMEPTQQPWIFGLHLAEPVSRNLMQSRNFEIFNGGPISKRFSYDLQTYRDSDTDLILLDSARRRATNLPDTGNEQSRALAQQLYARSSDDLDYVYQVLAHFQQNPFFYTLNPALLGEQRVDDFLFNTQAGFCEHFASAFSFLMRAAGIPSRVVVGYQGAEYNRYEDYMMVYQYNAHAWNEVWLEGRGWVRVDPTAAVSPERIQLGVEAALGNDPAFLEQSLFSAARLGSLSWLNALRLRLDAIEYEWNRRVVNYDGEVQSEFFERLFGEVTDGKVVALLTGLAAVVIGAVALTVIKGKPRSSDNPVNRLYLRVCRELEKAGLGRRRGEGPLRYRDRVISERPDLAPLMTELTELYVDLNYRHRSESDRGRKQQMQLLKGMLTRMRLKLLPGRRLGRSV